MLGDDGKPLVAKMPGGGGVVVPPGGSIGPGGVILDANGNPVLGADGKPMVATDPRVPAGGSIGEGGVILDANGNPVLDANGRPMRVNAIDNTPGAGGPNSRDKGSQCDDLGGGKRAGGGGGGASGGSSKKKKGGGGGDGEEGGVKRKNTSFDLSGMGLDDEDDEDDGTDALAAMAEVDRLMRMRGGKRQRSSRMITNLKGGKVMPSWMVHKAAGTLMQSRIDYEKQLAERGHDEEGEEAEQHDFGEFCEDQFVELYGLQKVAKENLRDMLKGLKKSSDKHARLKIFRMMCGLVPGDEEEDLLMAEGASLFYRTALRHLVIILSEDHLSGLKGSAFWTHYAKPDCVRLPLIYLEKLQDKLEKLAKLEERKAEEVIAGETKTRKQRAEGQRRMLELQRMVKCCELALLDHGAGRMPDSPDLEGPEAEGKPKIFEYGNPEHGAKPRTKQTTKKPMNSRCCIDCFLYRALEHWLRLEEEEKDSIIISFRSWDANGDGVLQLDEFAHMVKFANPSAGKKRITNCFVAACGLEDEHVDTERLVPALRLFELQLKDQPDGWTPPDPEKLKAEARAAKEREEAERMRGMNNTEREVETDAKESMANAAMALRQLSTITKVLKALGKNMEHVTEEDAMRLLDNMG